jgi:cell division protein ZipA
VAELRWILLGFGLLVIAGIWLWGRRRSAAAGDENAALTRGAERYEPRMDGEVHAADGEYGAGAGHGEAREHGHDPALHDDDLPTIELLARGYDERRANGANPPVVTIDDLPDNAEDVVLVDAPDTVAVEPMHVDPPPRRQQPPVVVPPRPAPPPVVERLEEDVADNAPHDEPPTVTIEVPTLAPEAAVVERRRQRPPAPPPVVPPLPPPPATSDPLADTMVGAHKRHALPAEPPPRQQRIVAIRLIALPETEIDGATLQTSLAAERLVFGRYSIFHRLLEGDRPVYSVASLVEPGSFEPELMASVKFPGVSLFAVFPGPLPAPQAFDELLACARRLGDKLGCMLQDDTGSSLTGQRVLSLREDLVHFEHLVSLGRGGRPAG